MTDQSQSAAVIRRNPLNDFADRWAVDHDDRPGMEWNRHIVVEDNPDHRICFMAHSGGRDPEQDEANANMIAAAPELLASLQEIVSEWGYPNTPKWHRARDALDKAEGRKGAR